MELPVQTACELMSNGIGAAFLTRTIAAEDIAAGKIVEIPISDISPIYRELALVRLTRTRMLGDAAIVANRKRGGVDKTDPATSATLGVEIGSERHQKRGHQLHEAVIADQDGKRALQVALDVLGVIRFEGPIVGLMEQDHDRHHAHSQTFVWHASDGTGLPQAYSQTRWEQIATRNRPQNKTVRVYSIPESVK